MDQPQQQVDHASESVNPLAECLSLEDITKPGAYVCHWNGSLLRVTDAEVPEDLQTEPALEADTDTFLVTRVSDDPYVPISVARMAAANLDLEISF